MYRHKLSFSKFLNTGLVSIAIGLFTIVVLNASTINAYAQNSESSILNSSVYTTYPSSHPSISKTATTSMSPTTLTSSPSTAASSGPTTNTLKAKTAAPTAIREIIRIPEVDTGEKTPPVTIKLAGRGSGNLLAFSISSNPFHGTLSSISSYAKISDETRATVTYTPNANFFGADSFLFRVSDPVRGKQSSPARVEISAGLAGEPPKAKTAAPTAIPAEIYASRDFLPFLDIELAGRGSGNLLAFSISSNPARGTLSPISSYELTSNETKATLYYTPNSNFIFGADSFLFRVSDPVRGKQSSPARVSITLHR